MSIDPEQLAALVGVRQRQQGLNTQQQILEELKKQNELLRRQSLPAEEQRRLAEMDRQAELAAAQTAAYVAAENLKNRYDSALFIGIIVGFLLIILGAAIFSH